MLEIKGKEMIVSCNKCSQSVSVPTSIGIIHLSEKGWGIFEREDNGQLVQLCPKCLSGTGLDITPDEIELI